MTKEITKAYILQELQDKFKLRDLVPETFQFSETVIPTYDIAGHTQRWEHKYQRESITGTGGKLFFTVPDDEVWSVRGYNMIFLGAGAIKMAGLYVRRKVTPSYSVYLDLKKNQTESYIVNLHLLTKLYPGDALHVNCDDYTSTQDFDVYLDAMVEKIR